MPTTVTSSESSALPSDPARTAIIMLYHEPGMIADRVLPPTPPLSQSKFDYKRWKIDDAFQVPDTDLGRVSEPQTVEFEGEEVVDRTRHHGLRDFVPVSDVDEAMVNREGTPNWADPRDIAAIRLKHLLRLAREVRTANAVFNEANYGANYKETLAGNARFDNAASDPLGKLAEALETPIFRPNVIVFGQKPWLKFRQHAKVLKAVNRASGADSGLATRMDVAALLEVDEILVGRSRVASNVEGQDLALKRAWGNDISLIYRGAYAAGMAMPGGDAGSEMQEGADMISHKDSTTFGFTAVYQPEEALSAFRPTRGIKGAHELVVRESCLEVVSGGEGFGYHIKNAVA